MHAYSGHGARGKGQRRRRAGGAGGAGGGRGGARCRIARVNPAGANLAAQQAPLARVRAVASEMGLGAGAYVCRVGECNQRADVSATAPAISLASRACASWTSTSLTCSRAVCLWYASFVASSSRSWICSRSVLFCSVNCLRTTRERSPQGWDTPQQGWGRLATATLQAVQCQGGRGEERERRAGGRSRATR